MLIELPNGRWIDPTDVRGVEPMTGDEHGPRVRIDFCDGGFALVEFDLPGAARVWTREFAATVNMAKREAQEA